MRLSDITPYESDGNRAHMRVIVINTTRGSVGIAIKLVNSCIIVYLASV